MQPDAGGVDRTRTEVHKFQDFPSVDHPDHTFRAVSEDIYTEGDKHACGVISADYRALITYNASHVSAISLPCFRSFPFFHTDSRSSDLWRARISGRTQGSGGHKICLLRAGGAA